MILIRISLLIPNKTSSPNGLPKGWERSHSFLKKELRDVGTALFPLFRYVQLLGQTRATHHIENQKIPHKTTTQSPLSSNLWTQFREGEPHLGSGFKTLAQPWPCCGRGKTVVGSWAVIRLCVHLPCSSYSEPFFHSWEKSHTGT